MFRMCAMKNHRGQAALEYLLLIVISLGVIGGGLYQFNSAFRDYAQQLFGQEGYFACLIEEGLLPGDESPECLSPSFDLNSAKKARFSENTISTGGGGRNSSANKSPSKTETEFAANGNSPTLKGQTKESGGGSIPTNSRDGIGVKLSQKSPSTQLLATNKKDAPNTGNMGNSSTEAGFLDSLTQGGQGTRNIPLNEADGVKGGQTSKTETIPTNERDLKTSRELAAEKIKKKKLAEVNSNFSFGNILKYLIIGALLFSIIFFIGSQVVAIGRSRRRN